MIEQRPATLPTVVCIMGPTGAGKTDLALSLAERWPIDIVSVDSAMVYRGLDIGTGKPSREILARVQHALVDILDPAEPYSAGQFVRDARAAIASSHARGRLPVLVGGTMLYFRALRRGLAELPQASPEVRARLDAEAAVRGWPAMHAELARVDPMAAARIQPNDSQRTQRALEVYELTGRTLTDLHVAATSRAEDLAFHAYAWSPSDRQRLYAAIEQRFHAMLQAGFLEEVRALHAREDLHSRLPAIRSVGYRQLWEHIEGEIALERATEAAILATRHLARRQLVWLRSDRELHWIDAAESGGRDQIERRIASLLTTRNTRLSGE